MKKPCEIKKDIIECMDEAIVVSETGDAHDLSDFADKAHVCMAVTLTYIQQLEQELAAVNRERKALMLDFQTCVKRTRKVCSVCSNKGKPICNMCERCDVFEWRGVCPENTEVQGDD